MVMSVCLLYVYDMFGRRVGIRGQNHTQKGLYQVSPKEIGRRNIDPTHVRLSSVEIWMSYMNYIN